MGFWLASQKADQNDIENQTGRVEILNNFEQFKQEMLSKYNDGTSIMVNPAYMSNYVLNKLGNDSSYTEPCDLLADPDHFDPYYSYQMHYLRSYSQLRHNATIGKQSKKATENRQEGTGNAFISLQKALSQIQNVVMPQLQSAILQLGPEAIGTPLHKQLDNKLRLLDTAARNLKENLDFIERENKPGKNTILISGDKLQTYSGLFKDQIDSKDLNEFSSFGLSFLYHAGSKAYTKDYLSGTLVALAGIAQVVVGAIVAIGSAGFAAEFGISLAIGGIGDIITGVNAALKGQEIKFGDWLTGKGIEIAAALAMAGISSVIEKAGEVGKIAIKVTDSAKEIHKLTAVGFGFAIGKKLATSYIVDLAVKGVANLAAKPIKNEIKDFENAIRQKLQEGSINNQLQEICLVDLLHRPGGHKQQFQSKVLSVIERKSSQFANIAQSLLTHTMSSAVKAKRASDAASTIITVASTSYSVAKGIGEINDLKEFVLSGISDSANSTHASLPAFEQLLEYSCRGISKEEVTVITQKLQQEGILQDKYRVDPSKVEALEASSGRSSAANQPRPVSVNPNNNQNEFHRHQARSQMPEQVQTFEEPVNRTIPKSNTYFVDDRQGPSEIKNQGQRWHLQTKELLSDLKKGSSANYTPEIEQMASNVAKVVGDRMQGLITSGIISPITSAVVSASIEHVLDKTQLKENIQEYFDKRSKVAQKEKTAAAAGDEDLSLFEQLQNKAKSFFSAETEQLQKEQKSEEQNSNSSDNNNDKNNDSDGSTDNSNSNNKDNSADNSNDKSSTNNKVSSKKKNPPKAPPKPPTPPNMQEYEEIDPAATNTNANNKADDTKLKEYQGQANTSSKGKASTSAKSKGKEKISENDSDSNYYEDNNGNTFSRNIYNDKDKINIPSSILNPPQLLMHGLDPNLESDLEINKIAGKKIGEGVTFVKNNPIEALDLACNVAHLVYMFSPQGQGINVLRVNMSAIKTAFKSAAKGAAKSMFKNSATSGVTKMTEPVSGNVIEGFAKNNNGVFTSNSSSNTGNVNTSNMITKNAQQQQPVVQSFGDTKFLPYYSNTVIKQPPQSVVIKSNTSLDALDLAKPSKSLLHNEGVVGKYGVVKKPPSSKIGDKLAAHHMPNKSFLYQYGVMPDDGISMLVENKRHIEIHNLDGMRYLDNDLNPRSALAKTILGARQVYVKQNVYTPKIKQGLQEVSKLNKETYPHVFEKGAQPDVVKQNYLLNTKDKQKKLIAVKDSGSSSNSSNDTTTSSSMSKINKPSDGVESINIYQKSYSIKLNSKIHINYNKIEVYNDANNDLINTSNNNSSHLNVIKTVQALMLIIDFITPEWVKTLILSLHPIKNMEKHFKLPSNDPVNFVIELKEVKTINHQKVEVNDFHKVKEAQQKRNEFDETLERSTISQSAEINYKEFVGKHRPSEDVVLEQRPDGSYNLEYLWSLGENEYKVLDNKVRSSHIHLFKHCHSVFEFYQEAELFGCNDMIVDVY